ncbi:MAG: DNA translocase FtsK, partial [Eubacteriales bacterium]|nr:DNA translocase FtsK [Eubacteriales bacterium]
DYDDEPTDVQIDDMPVDEPDIPFWKANPDAVIGMHEATQEDEYLPQEEEEPFVPQEEPEIPAYRPPMRRAQAAEEDDADDAESTPLSRSILAAQRAAQGNAPRVQDVLAAQQAAVKDQTIVQLRGERADGTPLVMPRKDAHEAPKILNEEYIYPPIDLLKESSSTHDPNIKAKIDANSRKLLSTLNNFGVQAELTHVTHGPAITRYELKPAPGVKVSRIVNLVDDIALNMASDGVRIEAPIPGKPAVGIEIPNEKIETVSLRDVLESREMTREKSPTAVALGKGISGAPVIADMAKMPHVLIAGATGSGKSVCINTIINSIIYRASPREVRLILIDPKVVELSVYNGIPHLLVPVVTDPKKASAALSWAVVEMEHRYKRFETMGVRNIKGYNDAIGPDEEPMSKIIVIIDELADLMMVAPGEVEDSICRLAQLARAAGIHLVIATQRPSVNVITGVIKANIPSRIAFAVSSQIDSRTILDAAGAEKLLGRGDMLYALQGAGKPTRVQGCFVSDDEVQRIVDFVRGKHEADYNEDVIEQMNAAGEEEKAASGDAPSGAEPVDEMLAKAIELAVESGQVSISMLQRRLRVGYARAGRLVDEMTLRGIAGEAEGPTKPRTVLISREEWRRMQENQE